MGDRRISLISICDLSVPALPDDARLTLHLYIKSQINKEANIHIRTESCGPTQWTLSNCIPYC